MSIAIKIKASKTDQFAVGTTVYIGRTSNDLCPVAALLGYMAVKLPGEGPLFISACRAPLTKDAFMRQIKEALRQAGIDAAGYKGHSFRIGAATTATTACGVNEGLNKSLGRDPVPLTNPTYIRIPPAELSRLSAVLAQNSPGIHKHAVVILSQSPLITVMLSNVDSQ